MTGDDRPELVDVLKAATFHEGTLRLVVSLPADLAGGDVSFELVGHRKLDSSWVASFSATQEHDEIVGEIGLSPDWGPVVELSAITVGIDGDAGQGVRLKGGVDFARVLFASKDGAVVSGPEAAAELERVFEKRQQHFDVPVGSGPRAYRAVVIAEGILLSRDMRVPGLTVHRLTESTRGSDLPEVLNAVLTQLGFSGAVDPTAIVAEHRSRRPTLVLSLPDVRATDTAAAEDQVLDAAQVMVDALSLQRDSAGSLVASVVESVGEPTLERVEWLGVAPYTGNLMTGVFSGEDQEGLGVIHDRLQQDDRLKLWLSLHRDALDERRWDYRFFRHFNLLETIGREVFGENALVLDFDGNAILRPDRKPQTTRTARGKVFALLRWWSQQTRAAEQNLCTEGAASLWDEVGVWVGIRDAVAHDGGCRPDSGDRINSAKCVPIAFARVAGIQPLLHPADAYLFEIRQATKYVLSAFLFSRLQTTAQGSTEPGEPDA